MEWLQTLAAEFALTAGDGQVWFAIGTAFVFGLVCLAVGLLVARAVGLLDPDVPAGETFAVGLGTGLVVLAAWWAAVSSGGRSSFAPVAIGFALAIAFIVIERRRRPADLTASAPDATEPDRTSNEPLAARASPGRGLILAVALGGVFVAVVALLYGATMVQSPRDGVQPLEFLDEAFYSILGADLANTGTETIYSPSGLAPLEGFPEQTWYHWGELWLASAVIKLLGTAPLAARHFIVLPVMLLAAALLTGTLVRRVAGTTSRAAFLFGFLACVFLAPVPVIAGPFFSSWAVGLIFGITLYGLAAVGALLSVYCLWVLAERPESWALAVFVGSTFTLLVPAHLLIAGLGVIGLGAVWTMRVLSSLRTTGRLRVVPAMWRRVWLVTAVAVAVTVVWGLLTGHGVGGSGSSASVPAFNPSWRDSVLITLLGSGAFLAIPGAWLLVHRQRPREADLYVGAAAILVAGAVAWGARLGDFNMFHAFFGGIAVFATPVAVIALWSMAKRLRASGRPLLASGVIVLCLVQTEVGMGTGILRLQRFGPGNYEPVPLGILAAIERLPADARLAYSCQPAEELAIWDARLLGISAHTARRVVPMCFQSESLAQLAGGQASLDVANPLFLSAPQRALYPTSSASPSTESVVSFLKTHGIHYIYADRAHPNALVADARVVAADGEFQVLQLP
jgi:hypothetical protein